MTTVPTATTGPRVLVGAFSVEGDSFVPAETSRADFERQVWATGDDIGRDSAGSTNELAAPGTHSSRPG